MQRSRVKSSAALQNDLDLSDSSGWLTGWLDCSSLPSCMAEAAAVTVVEPTAELPGDAGPTAAESKDIRSWRIVSSSSLESTCQRACSKKFSLSPLKLRAEKLSVGPFDECSVPVNDVLAHITSNHDNTHSVDMTYDRPSTVILDNVSNGFSCGLATQHLKYDLQGPLTFLRIH